MFAAGLAENGSIGHLAQASSGRHTHTVTPVTGTYKRIFQFAVLSAVYAGLAGSDFFVCLFLFCLSEDSSRIIHR